MAGRSPRQLAHKRDEQAKESVWIEREWIEWNGMKWINWFDGWKESINLWMTMEWNERNAAPTSQTRGGKLFTQLSFFCGCGWKSQQKKRGVAWCSSFFFLLSWWNQLHASPNQRFVGQLVGSSPSQLSLRSSSFNWFNKSIEKREQLSWKEMAPNHTRSLSSPFLRGPTQKEKERAREAKKWIINKINGRVSLELDWSWLGASPITRCPLIQIKDLIEGPDNYSIQFHETNSTKQKEK